MFQDGQTKNLFNTSLSDESQLEKIKRCVEIGLLCTQDSPKMRPSMSMVAKMLKGECAVGDKIMRPGLITDVMDLKVRTVGPVQFSLSPSMSPALSNSLLSTLAVAGSTVVEENP